MSDAPVAIITGAGTGIGRAAALELAESGWRCALVGRRVDRLDETAVAMGQRHANAPVALTIAVDIAEPQAAELIVDSVRQRWGDRIDALINNAATLIASPIYRADDAGLQRSFAVNVLAPVRLVQCAWPVMQSSGGGRIINISSRSSIDPFPGLGVYGMTKAALEGLARAINNEGTKDRIVAFSLVLGAVETDMLRSFASEKMLPRSRTRDPADIGRVIAAIARGERDADAASPIILN